MKLIAFILRLLTLGLFIAFANAQGSRLISLKEHSPAQTWKTSTPEEQGVDSGELSKLFDLVKKNQVNIHSLQVIRNGVLVLDAYFYPYSQGVPHDIASVTKSLTSTLIGIAIDKGYIKSVDERVLGIFNDRPVKNLDANKRQLTIRHLLTMTSGYLLGFDQDDPLLDRMRRTNDWTQFMLDQPLAVKPGTEYGYCTGASHLLSAIITHTTGMNELAFAQKYLFQPLGVKGVHWPVDPQENNTGGFDFFIQPLDLAKIGYLFLNDGRWNGKQIISSEWIHEATRRQVEVPGGEDGYGFGWWLPTSVPGLYEGRGRGGQRLSIWPEKNLVVVMFGGSRFEPGEIGSFVASSIKSDQPLPPNPEANTILRSKILEAAKAPTLSSPKPLPLLAHSISGVTFTCEPNDFGLKAFTLTFDSDTVAILKLTVDIIVSLEKGDYSLRVGLDGRDQISPFARYNLPAAARGSWTSDRDFEIVLNAFAHNHFYNIQIHFEDDRGVWRMSEGNWNMTVVGRVQK
jgi:CubicO group peptidase (beta-lactamase class C family)